jgi:hypothetical protein
MQTHIIKFEFNQQEVDFEHSNEKLMVNATQMAKIFGKDVFQFTRIEGTKSFINSCLKPQNCGLLGVNCEADLIVSTQKSGTWMHRVLALKFAAWLDPDFEVWVYSTIDQLVFGRYKRMEESLRLSAIRQNRIEEIKNELRDDDRFAELERLIFEDGQLMRGRQRENKSQLDLFRSMEVQNGN